MTLDDCERLFIRFTIVHVFFGAQHVNGNEEPYQTVSEENVTLDSGLAMLMCIFAKVPWRWVSNGIGIIAI